MYWFLFRAFNSSNSHPVLVLYVPFPVDRGGVEVVCRRPPYAAFHAGAQGTARFRKAVENHVRAAQAIASKMRREKAQ